jgi:hypothetical protein
MYHVMSCGDQREDIFLKERAGMPGQRPTPLARGLLTEKHLKGGPRLEGASSGQGAFWKHPQARGALLKGASNGQGPICKVSD